MNPRTLAITAVLLAGSVTAQARAQTQYVYDRERPIMDQAQAWTQIDGLRGLDLIDAPISDDLLVDHVAGLTTLHELSLRSHRITPKGFAAISTLTNLRSLEFGGVGAEQEQALFKALADLPLIELRLNAGTVNSLKGFDQMRCRATLERLEIQQNRRDLADAELAHLAGFTELRHLDLSGNTNIRGGISHLHSLNKLESLSLYGVPHVEDKPLTELFKHTPRLTHLNLGFCWGHKGHGLVLPASLTHLNLIESKSLTDAAFAELPCRDSLVQVNLFQCLMLTDKAIQAFDGAKNIEHLNVGCIRALTGKSLAVIGGLDTLTHLNISDNDNFVDADLAHLAGLTRLESLNLWHLRGVTGPGLEHLAKMRGLAELNLADCKNLQDEGVIAVADLPALEVLCLDNDTKLTDRGIAALAGHKRLKELTLSGCEQLTDASLQTLATIRSLKYLDIRGCPEINDAAIASLRKALPACQIVR